MSQAHPLGEEPPAKKLRVVQDRKPEIYLLQNQLREKRSALRKMEEVEEEKEHNVF